MIHIVLLLVNILRLLRLDLSVRLLGLILHLLHLLNHGRLCYCRISSIALVPRVEIVRAWLMLHLLLLGLLQDLIQSFEDLLLNELLLVLVLDDFLVQLYLRLGYWLLLCDHRVSLF